jgi:hypothetical protein
MEMSKNETSQAAIVKWNDRHKIGTPVIYESIKDDPSTQRRTNTASAAFVAESGIAVIFLKGVSGYVALSHVTAESKLQSLRRNLEDAQTALHHELVVLYPEGRQVQVKLSSSQIQSTRGTVIAHGTGRFSGELRVRLDTPKKQVRDFPWERIE